MENRDFKIKMIELLKEGWENIDCVKAIFAAWVIMNNYDYKDEIVSKMKEDVCKESGIKETSEFFAELDSIFK